MESEFKYDLVSADTLHTLEKDPELLQSLCEPLRKIRLSAVYYDTPNRDLRAHHISLRTRMEDDTAVTCVKSSSAQAKASAAGLRQRQEIETQASSPEEALPAFCTILEPSVYQMIADALPHLTITGRLNYTRLTALLRVPHSQTLCHLCLDEGAFGKTPFYELELELFSGSLEILTAYAAALAARYGIAPQPLSKQGRAVKACQKA